VNSRLIALSLTLGMSFGILVAYISSLTAIVLVVVVITASIVASTTADLTKLKEEKILPALMVIFAIVVAASALLMPAPYNYYLFYELLAVNFGLLIAYVAMRLADDRTKHGQKYGTWKNATR
jgi:heme A synthase